MDKKLRWFRIFCNSSLLNYIWVRIEVVQIIYGKEVSSFVFGETVVGITDNR